MTMKNVFPYLLAGLFAIATVACDDSQGVEDDNQGGNNNQGSKEYNFDVLHGEDLIKTINAAALPTKTVTINDESMDVVPVSDIIAKANDLTTDEALDAFLAKYLCDYEGEGGFRPSSKGDRCPPLSCSFTKMSYVNLSSERLVHDDAATELQVGCYSVTGVSKVILLDPDAH